MVAPQFERKITLGNVITLGVQVVLLVAFFAGLNFRVDAAQNGVTDLKNNDIAALKTNVASIADSIEPIDHRLTTVEDKQQAAADRGLVTQSTLKDIQATLSVVLQQTAAINARLGAQIQH